MKGLQQEISKTTIALLLKEPFFGHYFSGMLKEITTKVKTLAVGVAPNGLLTLYINPIFWEEKLASEALRIGAIKHELLHIALKHLLRIADFDNRTLFNIAADLVVNQYIAEERLLEGTVRLEQFTDLQLAPEQSVSYYYDRLVQYYRQQASRAQPRPDFLWLQEQLEQESETLARHALWGQGPLDTDAARQRLVERIIDVGLQNASRQAGKDYLGRLPTVIQTQINMAHGGAPVKDWRALLRLFVASSGSTQVKHTIHRSSKRYQTIPGIKVRRRLKLLIALDTSGSIRPTDLSQFFKEIYHLWRQGPEITIVECDTDIRHQFVYTGTNPDLVMGKGGTSFEAPIRWANESYHPDGLVYFTDGFGPPLNIKSRCPVLWLISSTGIKTNSSQWNQLPGRKIKLSDARNE